MLLDPRTRAWDAEACAAFGVDVATLAEVVPADEALGELRAEARSALGLRRHARGLRLRRRDGGHLGAGVVDPGVVCNVVGTAEPICAVTTEPCFDPTGLVECHPHADPETWLLENPGFVSGGGYRWFRDHLGREELAQAGDVRVDVYELLNALAATAPPGSDGVIWLPCLMGAMAPEWNADARACWYGLTPAHGREHLLRALLEGSAYALRDVLEAMRGAGVVIERVVCVAGGARSELWRRSAPTSPACRWAWPPTWRRPRAARPCSPPPERACTRRRRASAAMSREGGEPLLPDPERSAIYEQRTAPTARSTTRCGRCSRWAQGGARSPGRVAWRRKG